VHGEAASEIVRVAKERGVDLIVVSSHGRTGLGRILFGSTAEAVVRHASCPVLVVKPPPEQESS
jgi:nucleotide-binding universal stress UspA family protein